MTNAHLVGKLTIGAPMRLFALALLCFSNGSCSKDQTPPSIVLRPAPDSGVDTDAPTQLMQMFGDRCTIDAAYLDEHKQCEADADCVALAYRPTCCQNQQVVGIARTDEDTVSACAALAAPPCQCASAPPRAEDGRGVGDDQGEVSVHCLAGRCVSSVERRPCGKNAQCRHGDICVSYENVRDNPIDDADSGDNAYLTYKCLPNPCIGSLSCTCAKTACDIQADVSRRCQFEFVNDADITCMAFHD